MIIDLGVFITIGNNCWLILKTSPQFIPSFALNRTVVQKAEQYGLDFVLSMIKLRGFGGEPEFWDHNLESFTLMAGLAAVIRLYAIVAVRLPLPCVVSSLHCALGHALHHPRLREQEQGRHRNCRHLRQRHDPLWNWRRQVRHRALRAERHPIFLPVLLTNDLPGHQCIPGRSRIPVIGDPAFALDF
jgi:hypothetical protein